MRSLAPALLLCMIVAVAVADEAAEPQADADVLARQLAGETTYIQAVLRTPAGRAADTTLRQLAYQAAPRAANVAHVLPQQENAELRSTQALQARSRRFGRGGPLPPKASRDTTAQLELPQGVQQQRAPPPGGYSPAKVALSFTGLNAFDTRFAANGNQSTIDPPSQGLCVGSGYVLETVQTVLRVYDAASGAPVAGPVALNAFYGLPVQQNRSVTPNVWGPYITEPSCWFDAASRRWFHTVLTINFNTSTGEPTGPTYLDIAVSRSADPTGAWALYRITGSNNGDDGTPNAGCAGGFCKQEFPRLAVWDYAVVLTTNEVATLEDGAYGANVYAIDKAALVRGEPDATTALVRTGDYPTNGGVQLNSLIAARQSGACSIENNLIMGVPLDVRQGWVSTLQLLSLTGTASLGRPTPVVRLKWVRKEVQTGIQFAAPQPVAQRRGPTPSVQFWNASGGVPFAPSLLDANLGSLNSLSLVDDKLYAAWGSATQPEGGAEAAGVAWAVVDPQAPARTRRDGLFGLGGGNSLLCPYLAVRPGGIGVFSLSVVGPDYFPSPAFAVLGPNGAPAYDKVHLIAAGAGPTDSFSGYLSALEGGNGVARFGDDSAALVDPTGRTFWVASEWVAQTCNNTAWAKNQTCGGSRAPYANWATRVAKITID